MKNYFEILGVSRNATTPEIRAAYRKLAKKYHPDASDNSSESAERFREISEAYRVLSDEAERERYQRMGHSAYTSQTDFTRNAYHSEDEDLHCGRCKKQKEKDEDEPPPASIRIALWLTYEETLHEQKCTVNYKGWKLRVRIPKETHHRQFFVLREILCGKTDFFERPEHRDKFYVVIILLREHPVFKRQGYHLFTDVWVDYPTLVLGGTITIPSLEGDIAYELPPSHSLTQHIYLCGKGLFYPKKIGRRGDLHANIFLKVPSNLTPKQRAALEAYRDAMNETA